jgi:hypothetical protein
MNDNINMDSTIAGSINNNINMDRTIASSLNDIINMEQGLHTYCCGIFSFRDEKIGIPLPFLIPPHCHMLWSDLCSVRSDKMRGDCSFG